MLYILVALIALTAIKQWNPLFSPQAAIHRSDDYASTCAHRGCHNMLTCTTYDSFPNIDLTLDVNSVGSNWHLYHIPTGLETHTVGCVTHTAGCTTHTAFSHVTQHPFYASSVRCHYHSMPGHTTGHPLCISSKPHHNVTTCFGVTIKLSYLPRQSHHTIIVSAPCKLSEKTEIHTIVFKPLCFKSVTASILTHKRYFISQFDLKPCTHHKCSALPLILAINRSIYYLFNGNFNQAGDVNHLISRLLLTLLRYMTRHNDFKHRWFTLLLSGLLRSQHISLWFLIVLFLRIYVVAWKLFWFQKSIYTVNLIIKYAANLIIDKMVVLSSCLRFICFWICMKFIILQDPSIFLVADQNIKSTTGFVGGGRSARTNYDFLKPYVVSMEVQLKNPDDFSYIYGGHCTFDNAMQEIRTSGEARLVCNIPLALVANILTSIQANEVAKEHNLHALSRKSLAEKRTAVESHVCTITCNRCVTMFKPVKKKPKEYSASEEYQSERNKTSSKGWKKITRKVI